MRVIILGEIAADVALQTIEGRYGQAHLLYTSPVHFLLGRDMVNGNVHVLQLADGRVASVWMADGELSASGPQVHVVLHTRSITTPVDALRSVHLGQVYEEVGSAGTGGEQ